MGWKPTRNGIHGILMGYIWWLMDMTNMIVYEIYSTNIYLGLFDELIPQVMGMFMAIWDMVTSEYISKWWFNGTFMGRLQLSDAQKSWFEWRRASVRWDSLSNAQLTSKWLRITCRWHMRRDEMRWGEVRRAQMRWDEMKCGVWSVKCEVRSVKSAVCEV